MNLDNIKHALNKRQIKSIHKYLYKNEGNKINLETHQNTEREVIKTRLTGR